MSWASAIVLSLGRIRHATNGLGFEEAPSETEPAGAAWRAACASGDQVQLEAAEDQVIRAWARAAIARTVGR